MLNLFELHPAAIIPGSKHMAKILTTSSKKSELFGLHYCINHTGKMSGLQSLSTSVTTNKHCQARRAKGDSICAHCFAAAMMKRYSALEACTIENARILSAGLIPSENIPLIPVRYFRFESTGDLSSMIQAANYIRIAAANPDTMCALWTKNPQYIKQAIEAGYTIPSNLQIVLSSPLINKPIKSTVYPFISKIFTVYDKEGAKGVNINCGARSCLKCGRCYRSNPEGVKIQYINELLK